MRRMHTKEYEEAKDGWPAKKKFIGKDSRSQDEQPTEKTHTERNNEVQKTIPFSWKELFQPAVPGVSGLESTRFMPQSPTAFIIVGMMALFGSVAHTPIAVMVMLAEMTGNLSLLAPAMIALSISITIVGNNTIFRSQILDRMHSPRHKSI